MAVLAACLVYSATRTWGLIVESYTPFPIWDYWRAFQDYTDARAGNWGFLWHQYNEHRLVFPELVFVADMFWCHGLKILPLLLTSLCYLVTWLLLSMMVIRDKRVGPIAGLFASGVAGCVVLWPTAALPLAEAFLLQWTMMHLAVVLALLYLTRTRSQGNRFAFAGVVMAGVVATYSSGNGMLIWPVVWALAWMIRLRTKQIVTLFVAGSITIGCYFIHYASLGTLGVNSLFLHPWGALGFVTSYLSMPFGLISPTASRGLIAGAMSLVITVICLVMAMRHRWLGDPAAVVLFGFIAFNVLTALMTAAGRMSPADTAFAGAKQVRYINVPQMNWGAVILASLWIAGRLNVRKLFVPVLCLIALGLLLYLPRLDSWLTQNSEWLSEYQLVALGFEDGVPDWALATDRIYPNQQDLQAADKLLKQAQKSIYYHGRDRWLKKPLAQLAPTRWPVPGAIVTTFPIGTGIQVGGWLDDSKLRRNVLWVVLTDAEGIIQGFGRRFPAGGFPITADSQGIPPSLGWVGFVPADSTGKEIRAYAVDGRSQLRPLPGSFVIPPVTAADSSQRGEPIPGMSWTSKLTVAQNSLPVGMPPPGENPPGPVQATYGGSDATIGSVSSSEFARPADGCVVIPVLPGPSVLGLRVYLAEAATGKTVQELPLRNARNRWQFWRVQVDAARPALQVVLQDQGKEWGQWIATSTPLSCN